MFNRIKNWISIRRKKKLMDADFTLYVITGRHNSYQIRNRETNEPLLEPGFKDYKRYLAFDNKPDAKWFLYNVLSKDLTEEEMRKALVERFPNDSFRMNEEELKEYKEKLFGKPAVLDK